MQIVNAREIGALVREHRSKLKLSQADVEHAGAHYPFATGDVMLLPAVVGACRCHPNGSVTVLEISLPEISQP